MPVWGAPRGGDRLSTADPVLIGDLFPNSHNKYLWYGRIFPTNNSEEQSLLNFSSLTYSLLKSKKLFKKFFT